MNFFNHPNNTVRQHHGMDDELATESARAVERAAKMAGQAIHSATTAIHIAAKLQNDPDVGQMFNTT